jgi:hypothetical protein
MPRPLTERDAEHSGEQRPGPERSGLAGIWMGMRKHALVFVIAFLILAGFSLFTGWAAFALSHVAGGWKSLLPIWPYVLGGVVATGGLAGTLMWLAFYSANHGYDDRIDSDQL